MKAAVSSSSCACEHHRNELCILGAGILNCVKSKVTKMSGQDWNQFAQNMQQFGQDMSNLAQRMTITARQVQFGQNNVQFQTFGSGGTYVYGSSPQNPTSSSSTWTGNVQFVSTGDGQVFINGQRVHPPANSSTAGTPSSSIWLRGWPSLQGRFSLGRTMYNSKPLAVAVHMSMGAVLKNYMCLSSHCTVLIDVEVSCNFGGIWNLYKSIVMLEETTSYGWLMEEIFVLLIRNESPLIEIELYLKPQWNDICIQSGFTQC